MDCVELAVGHIEAQHPLDKAPFLFTSYNIF